MGILLLCSKQQQEVHATVIPLPTPFSQPDDQQGEGGGVEDSRQDRVQCYLTLTKEANTFCLLQEGSVLLHVQRPANLNGLKRQRIFILIHKTETIVYLVVTKLSYNQGNHADQILGNLVLVTPLPHFAN